jgi:hypothetical protein
VGTVEGKGEPMKYIVRRFLTLLVVVAVGALLGGLVSGIFMGGWAEGMIFGGILGAVVGMLYDPRAATYTVPTRGGAEYPGNRDDYRP